jgi:CO/xanthine dehydrogenase FAD-binding subunit
MKPPPFTYHAPATGREVVATLAGLGEEGRVLAGGQSLVPLMNFRLAQPAHLVDINRVDELDYLRREDGALAIGARARQSALEREEAARSVPLLAEAGALVAHPAIRHRGTVCGSVAHADPAAELPAAFLAQGGEAVLRGPGGERRVPFADLFQGPFTTAVGPGELLTEVRAELWPDRTGHAFVEFARRDGDFAIAGAAVLLHLDGAIVDRAAIALCGVAPTPVRAGGAEEALAGQEPGDEVIAEAVEASVRGLTPASDLHGGTDYRVRVARACVRRALRLALARARGERQ